MGPNLTQYPKMIADIPQEEESNPFVYVYVSSSLNTSAAGTFRRTSLPLNPSTNDLILFLKTFDLIRGSYGLRCSARFMRRSNRVAMPSCRLTQATRERHNPSIIEQTRQYIRDFSRSAKMTTTALQFYDKMLKSGIRIGSIMGWALEFCASSQNGNLGVANA
jgi:hypothetical protein